VQTGTVLAYLLDETERFEQGTNDLPGLATAAATDEAAVRTAGPLLRTFRLALAFEAHENEGTPELRRALEPLAAFANDSDEHRDQFDEAEYEIHAASLFVGCGKRVSFVNPDRGGRYRRHVEFMLGYRFPVECKRPRARHRIAPITVEAAEKIDERRQPGVVCVALENALPSTAEFREVLSEAELTRTVAEDFSKFWDREGARCETAFRNGYVRYIVFNYLRAGILHDTGSAGFPSLLICRTQDGRWVNRDSARTVVDELAALVAAPIG